MRQDDPRVVSSEAPALLGALPRYGSFVLLVVGVGITVWQWTHPAEFGWFAYAPLSDTVLNPTRPLVFGYCLSVLGALGLGAGTYLIVRRGHS